MTTATQPIKTHETADPAFLHISDHVGFVCDVADTGTKKTGDNAWETDPVYQIDAPKTVRVPLVDGMDLPVSIGGEANLSEPVGSGWRVCFEFEVALLRIEAGYAVYRLTVDGERWFSAY